MSKLTDRLLGRSKYQERKMKPISLNKNPDGSIDTTPRILLVFPIFSHVYAQAFGAFMAAIAHASRHCPDFKFDIFTPERMLLHTAMNMAAQTCIQNPFYQGMIAFDDDCLPPAHIIQRMLNHHKEGRHIVAGVGYMRGFPHTTTVGRYLKQGQTLVGHEARGFEWLDDLPMEEVGEHGLLTVDFCGMPAMFISRTCLYALDVPHFAHSDKTGSTTTHDIYFCNKARDRGFDIKVDVTLECAHIGPAPLITRVSRDAARAAVEYSSGTHHQG